MILKHVSLVIRRTLQDEFIRNGYELLEEMNFSVCSVKNTLMFAMICEKTFYPRCWKIRMLSTVSPAYKYVRITLPIYSHFPLS